MPFVAISADLEIIILSETREQKRQIPYITQTIWNLRCDTNEFIHDTETDSQTERTGLWLSRGGRMGWEFGISRWKLLYREY